MQEIMLNTKNLNVVADSVDDIIVVDDKSSENDQPKKFKAIGVKLGGYYIVDINL